ncbi:OsmC family protein [Pseudobowmanella zhangzhouensis]|uniref:OsmC family protein n=1 Tax=Pseudobowmanella zhangzhouensis TaxID=1537679 RepID=UPI00361F2C4A
MSDEQHTIDVQLTLLDGYKFEVDFGEMGQLFTDEPPPLGKGHGPNPGKLLIASVANCLAASLMFAIRKFKEDRVKCPPMCVEICNASMVAGASHTFRWISN